MGPMTKSRTYRPRRSRIWFLAFALLTVLGLFVIDGPLGGVALAAGTLALFVGFVMALAGEDTRPYERGGFLGG
jgi:hypothetical protein